MGRYQFDSPVTGALTQADETKSLLQLTKRKE